MRSFGSIPFQSPSGQAPQSMAEQCPGPYLEILRGRTDFPLRPLELERFLIGAGSQCTLQLGGEGMPILHSLITRTAGGYQIEALASFPMLRINGQPARSGALTDGDLVMIGAFEFGIRLPALSTANAEPSNQLLDVEAILREADREARSIPDMSVEELLAGLEDFTQQFDARDRGTQPHVEGPPMPRVVQRRGHAVNPVAEEGYGRHTRQPPALPEDQIRMQVPDDRLLDLRQPGTDQLVFPEKRQGRRIVAKKQDTLLRFQIRKRLVNFRQMCRPQFFPPGSFVRQRITLVNRQRDQRRGHTEQDVISPRHAPKRVQAQSVHGARPARQPHAATLAEEPDFAQFVVANGGVKVRAEFIPQFDKALLCARERGVIAHTHKRGVAGEIAVGDYTVGRFGMAEKAVKLAVVREGIAHPDVAVILFCQQAEPRSGNGAPLKVSAGLLRRAGVMNVADNENG